MYAWARKWLGRAVKAGVLATLFAVGALVGYAAAPPASGSSQTAVEARKNVEVKWPEWTGSGRGSVVWDGKRVVVGDDLEGVRLVHLFTGGRAALVARDRHVWMWERGSKPIDRGPSRIFAAALAARREQFTAP